MPSTMSASQTKNGSSVMAEFISRLNDKITSLEAFTTRLENVGHRMKDTNVPQSESKGPVPERNGFLSEFESSLQTFGYINERLITLAEKMEGII